MRLGLITLLTLTLIGCGGLEGGKVIDTKFVPAHVEQYTAWEVWYYSTTMQPIYHSVQHERNVPDLWAVEIQGNCGQNGDEQKCDTAWKEVNQQAYNAATHGDLKWYGPTPKT